MVRKVRHWIDNCVKNHKCSIKIRDETFVPTRLVELLGDAPEKLRLVLPTAPVEYVALSYCWGHKTQSTTTTKENLDLRHRGIDASKLPRTLRDAITMTRALGLQYLWIDALCIVQDDPDDWAAEASRMAGVYSGADIVLAATNTSDCDDGFLHPRPESVIIKTAKAPPVHVRRADCHHTYNGHFRLQRYPLSNRAWW